MIKGAQSINEFKLRKWIDDHFLSESVKVEMDKSCDFCKITDSIGDSIYAGFSGNEIITSDDANVFKRS